ncbi:tetratricopeptide repeat protein [Shewanella sp. H8]|uniref:tetratricopeptide repeat protein n=1 Tax=Shewanella sp. H8 TaxID=3342676 RepID=UPI0033154BA7
MSVIIKMLKDLELRQQSETGIPPTQPAGEFVRPQIQYQSTAKSRLPLISLIVVAILLIPTLWFGVSIYRQANNEIVSELASISSIVTRETESLDVNLPQKNDGLDVEQSKLVLNPTSTRMQTSALVSTAVITQNAAQIRDQISMPGSPAVDTAPVLDDDTMSLSPASQRQDSVNVPETVETPTLLTTTEESDKSSFTDANKAVPSKTVNNNTISNNVVPDSIESTKVSPNKNASNNIEATQGLTTEQTSASSIQESVTRQMPAGMTVKEVVLTKAQMAQLQYRKAMNAEQEQRLDDATGYYLEAIVLQPSLHKARKQLVAIYYAQHNLIAVMRLLESGISLFPQQWEFYVILSQIQTEMKAYDKALSTLDMIPDNSTWARDKWVAQTELAQSSKNFFLAESAYRNLLVSESTNSRWWMGLGYALDSQKKYSQAAQAYRSALSYEGLSTSAMSFIEKRLVQLGENR